MFRKAQRVIFDTLFEAVSESVIVIDKLQKIRIVNSNSQKMFGYSEKELLGSPLAMLIANEYKKSHLNFFIENQEKKSIGKENDLYAVHKNGNNFPIEVSLNPFKIDGIQYIMALVVDTSLHRNQEEKIVELNTELENNVKKRTTSLTNTVEELEIINRQLDEENKKRINTENQVTIALKKERELSDLKTKFLSMVSHEFKTPLTGISISTMLLGKYKLTEHHEKREKHLTIINSKVHYLNGILNNFLSIEKLEKKEIKYNITSFDLKKVVDEVMKGANLLLKKGQEIKCSSNIDAISLFQDEKIIELTLSNLLNNAIKYSREGTKIYISVDQNVNNTIINIKDKGFGIPEKEQANIFKRYYRAANVLLIEGTGIGLNIIKTHLTNLGGTITFTSKQNIGTTFTITIPNKFK